MARSAETAKEAGFTLVELLVVVFIIGLMAGLVVVNLPRPASPAEAHARALTRALHQAARESIISGQPMSWSVRAGGESRFERYVAGDWEGVDNPPMGRSATSDSAPIIVEVSYPDGGLRPDAPEETEAERLAGRNSRFVRKLVFSPVGEATPAEIRVRASDEEYAVMVHADGRVEWRGANGPGRR